MEKKKIVVIGGGLSGVLVAMRLSEIENGPEVILIEKDPEKLGRGVAYQQEFTHQPLNVIAGGMSLSADKPNDFVEWLGINSFRYKHLITEISSDSFIPRKIFGDYLVERMKDAHDKAGERLQIRIEEAVSVTEENGEYAVTLGSGIVLNAAHVVLALGNFPPADVLPTGVELKNKSRYFSNPWTDKVYQHITGNENILLIGTGLTAVDVVLGLNVRNFNGKIVMLSRRGKLPLPHFISPEKYFWKDEYLTDPRTLFRLIRKNIKENPHVAWPLILDSLRPHIQKIWRHWKTEDKSFFLKRLRPFWEVARHRIPGASSDILEELTAKGKLNALKGNVIKIEELEEGLKTTFSDGTKSNVIFFQKIINCTGPESNYRKVKFPIITSLMEKGKVVPDALGLGIVCDENGCILDKDNNIVPGLWCVGPMRKAVLWETTALREIREQADELKKNISLNGIK